VIDGIQFRFIDTAGIRSTNDTVESLGIERTFSKIDQAEIVLVLVDATNLSSEEFFENEKVKSKISSKNSVMIINKIDIAPEANVEKMKQIACELGMDAIAISAKKHINISQLVDFLVKSVHQTGISENDVIITNIRHFEALSNANEAINRVVAGLKEHISGDFLSQDIRECLHYMGEITGEITTDEVLGNIFKNFCIGK